MALGGAIFTVMLQLTLVSERGPLRDRPPVPAGLLALAFSWACGGALYALAVGAGLVDREAFGAVLVCIGALQVVGFVVLGGWPFARIAARGTRIAAANAAVLAGGGLVYALLAGPLGLAPVTVTALAGAAVASGLTVGMLFEGWLRSRAANAAAVAVLAALLYAGLEAIAHAASWTRAEPEAWIAYAGLNAIGVGVILHVAIGRRWPFAADDPEGGTT